MIDCVCCDPIEAEGRLSEPQKREKFQLKTGIILDMTRESQWCVNHFDIFVHSTDSFDENTIRDSFLLKHNSRKIFEYWSDRSKKYEISCNASVSRTKCRLFSVASNMKTSINEFITRFTSDENFNPFGLCFSAHFHSTSMEFNERELSVSIIICTLWAVGLTAGLTVGLTRG